MKYFIDTEFLEGSQKKRFFNVSYGKTKPTIDLISIGIVAEDGREYYAISKDFNLEEAWNRFDKKTKTGNNKYRDYWIRENALRPIFTELNNKAIRDEEYIKRHLYSVARSKFSYEDMKILLDYYAKPNSQIANEIIEFIYPLEQWQKLHSGSFIDPSHPKHLTIGLGTFGTVKELLLYSVPQIEPPEFYAYYADYDWVAFCWLFGRMIDLPKGFPMYCRDLKQILDEKAESKKEEWFKSKVQVYQDFDMINHIKTLPNYPKQSNEHDALSDARWNRELYSFINNI